jgi:peptidoglycan/xylan/chitin deacetylase (PgdA/CDA1 family)
VNERVAVLMYHDVSIGEPSGYTVSLDQLRQGLAAVGGPGSVPCQVTFDDGYAGTVQHALPALQENGIEATLFVTTGYLGRAGFIDEAMLRDWNAAGQKVGSHSVTHPVLNLMSEEEIRRELNDSRNCLEEILGAPIEEFSVPGGNFSARVSRLAFEAGYRRVYTSRPAYARAGRPVVPRFAIRATTPAGAVARLREGRVEPFFRSDRLRFAAKQAMGPRIYIGVRDRLRPASSQPEGADKSA